MRMAGHSCNIPKKEKTCLTFVTSLKPPYTIYALQQMNL